MDKKRYKSPMSKNQRFSLILPIIALFILILLTGIVTASAVIWYVDYDSGADFIRIQDAINNAAESNSNTITNNEGTLRRELMV